LSRGSTVEENVLQRVLKPPSILTVGRKVGKMRGNTAPEVLIVAGIAMRASSKLDIPQRRRAVVSSRLSVRAGWKPECVVGVEDMTRKGWHEPKHARHYVRYHVVFCSGRKSR